MTQNIPEILTNFDLTRAEGIQSILTLINLIPEPVFIYDRTDDAILSANNTLFLISAMEETDFIGENIQSLLADKTDTDPITGHGKSGLLRHKKLSPIPVNIRIFSLSHEKGLFLFLLKTENVKQPIKPSTSNQIDLLERLTPLFKQYNSQEISNRLTMSLEKAADILEMEIVCLYQISGNNLKLVQYVPSDPEIGFLPPDTLTKQDLEELEKITFWKSDRPAFTEFQRGIVKANLDYLISVPLGTEDSKVGIFLVAGLNKQYSKTSHALTELIGSYIGGLLDSQISIQNLQNLGKKVRQVVKIQNEIVTNLEEGVMILTPDLRIAEINPAAESILGYANIEALRQPASTILIGSDSLGAAFTSAKQGIPSLTSGDLTLHHRNGNSFPAQVMMSPVISRDKLFAIIILIRDMSHEQQSQAAKKQLEQRAILGEVMAIFAHEVRNPINAIMLAIQVMEGNLSPDDENLKWIDNIRDDCNKLMYLMESVLSFAKPLEYKMSGIDLDYLLRQILDRWHPRLLRLNISSYYESEIKTPIVYGDYRALEQVFTNLISNSINAMSGEGGSLGVKISNPEQEDDQKFIQVTITDSGHGIPDEIKAHMFEPFVTGRSHGTGLGLAITQRIINAHKGKIEVESFTGGTIFKIFINKTKGHSQ